jgi:RNA polymerase sigma factor (sigma-70 family)
MSEVGDPILGTIRKLLGTRAGLGADDAELLRRYVAQRDEAAFELLVWRHAGLVLAVCRQLLHDQHAVEDAFQAAFLVLARKAGSISRREALPGWLHRVAFRAALRARRQAERPGGAACGIDLDALAAPAGSAPMDADLRLLLHEEVLRLPARYRLPVICCYLEGKTHEEAARALGWPRGTVAGRLARARELLRRRLERRGVGPACAPLALEALGGAALTAGWGQRIAAAARALAGLAQDPSAPAGLSAGALALAEGVMLDMLRSKLKGMAIVLIGALAAGLGVLASGHAGLPRPPLAQAREERPAQEAPPGKPAGPAKGANDPVEEALLRARVRQQLRTLGEALSNYQAGYNHLPEPAIVGGNGKPLLSWRVAILPFIEQDALSRAFRLGEPWDSPHNKALIARMPAVFAPVRKPARPGETYFQYIVGPTAAFASHAQLPAFGAPGMPGGPGMGAGAPFAGLGRPPAGGGPGGMGPGRSERFTVIPTSFPDGTANTILLVEAGAPVVWTRPADVAYDPKKPVPRLGGQFDAVVHVLTADGSARALPRRLLDERTLRAAITPAGGEPVDVDRLAKAGTPGMVRREGALNRLRQRNRALKEEAALLNETLAELKQEVAGLRWAVEEDKLLALDPLAAGLHAENAQLDKALREAREEARKLLGEIGRLKEEMRKRKK